MTTLFSLNSIKPAQRGVGQSTLFRSTLLSLVLVSMLAVPSVHAAVTPSLGAAATYGILASTYTNTSAGTVINGDIGFTTGPAVAPAGTHPNYGSGAPYSTAGSDQGTALSSLASQPCTYSFPAGAVNLSTDTTHGPAGVYLPGVYCSAGAMNIGGPLTLNGNGTFIFRAGGALTSTAGAIVTLIGASACNVFWTPTQAVTLAANTRFAGIVIDNAGITVGANTVWSGMALAFGGTVTTDTTTLNVPVCTLAPSTLHVIKQVNGGSLSPSAFSLRVTLSGVDIAGSPAPGTLSPGTPYTVIPGTYTVSEDANPFYARTFSGDCSASGTVTLGLGEDKTCTITNTVLTSSPATLHVIKQVVNTHGGIKTPSNFWVRVKASGTDVPGSPAHGMAAPGTIYALAAGTYVVSENADASYVRSFSGDCDANGVVTLSAAADKTCTITNTDIAAASIYSSVSSSVPPTGGGGFQTQRPVIHVTKKPNRFRLPFGGGAVTYTYTVSNPGTVPLDSVQVSDDKCGPVTYRFGDLNGNGLLNADESWNYSCRSDIQSTTVNTVTATGKANNETALDTATARVIVAPVIAPAAPSVTAPPSSVMPPVPVLPITGVDFGSRSVQLVLLGLLMGVALLSLSVSRRLKTVINS